MRGGVRGRRRHSPALKYCTLQEREKISEELHLLIKSESCHKVFGEISRDGGKMKFVVKVVANELDHERQIW